MGMKSALLTSYRPLINDTLFMEWRKQILSSVASLLVCGFATAQSSHNYIRTDVMLDSAGASRMTTAKYYDGLGRLSRLSL